MYWCRFVLMCQHACKSSTNFTSNDTSIGLDSIFIQPASSELRHQADNVLADKVQSVRVLSTQSSARITFQNLQYIRHMEDPQASSGQTWTDLIQRMSDQSSHHCTIGYAMKIKKKKCLKVNTQFLLIFQRKQLIFLVQMEKCQCFATNIF